MAVGSHRFRWACLVIVGSLFGAGAAAAAPGDLDTTFGAVGAARIDFGGNEDAGNALAMQADGRIVLVGRSGGAFAVARLLPTNGTLDTTFGEASLGWRRYLVPGTINATGAATKLQPDGRIVIAGSADSAGLVAKLNADGSPDAAFGSAAGTAKFMTGLFTIGNALALQPDGNIVVAGTNNGGSLGNKGFAARLLSSQGVLDPAYASGTGFSNFAKVVERISGVGVQPDGRIVVAGTSLQGTSADVAVARVDVPSGLFDPSFNGTGWSRRDTGGVDETSAMVIQPDGKIVVVGFSDVNGGDFFVVRFMPDGKVDTTFAGTGSTILEFGGRRSLATSVALQSDGRIVIAGVVNGQTNDVGVVRLQPNGLPDTTFGANGRAVADFGANEDGTGIALQSDGNIVVVGSTNTKDKPPTSWRFAFSAKPRAPVAPRPRRRSVPGGWRR